MQITDFDIQALVDNELDPEKERIVIEHIQRDRSAKLRYQSLKAQKLLLQEWWNDKKKQRH